MDYARICRWLGLPDGDWPPNHYTLLGLEPGEQDAARLEAQYCQRMRLVRGYQLSLPELATEAMNRLAEAFACLSDPAARQRYNAERGITALPPRPVTSVENTAATSPKAKANKDTDASGMPTVLEWAGNAAPPVRHLTPASGVPAIPTKPTDAHVTAPSESEAGPSDAPAPPAAAAANAPPTVADPSETILAATQKSWKAWKGMWSRAILLERLGHTQALLRAWTQLGRFVGGDKRPLPPAQRKDFRARLERVDRLREELPQLLGEPGQPGYRVAILAQDEDPVRAFQDMGPDERHLLSQDWKIGATLLRSHVAFIETELSELHREGFLGNWLRPLRSFVNAHVGWVLAFLGLVVVLAGLWAVYHR